ncbi:hypothetical protein NM688_g1022 [Phlebia brevispora]|uniref:Uncharacterized protein n=1 Tax=Phlebia brevispora TaxID=194682 RepID=A0ACC1TCV3_9APHY|nr:hypothetical protein NM688_g1022 [Phlebia brevispora]
MTSLLASPYDEQRYCQYSQIISTPYGKAMQISLKLFLDHVLPPLKYTLAPDLVLQRLLYTGKRASTHKPLTLKRRWRGFAQDPTQVECDPQKVFLPFQHAVSAIIRASGADGTKPSFHHNLLCVMDGDTRTHDTLPDAYLTCGPSSRWTDIITFGEFHKECRSETVKDNVHKVTESMAKCMHHDARRRFVHAFTVEDKNMRLWYGDRSQVLVSEPFNFITDHIPMIHFFLSMAYAHPEEIGLDPTVALLEDGERYDITVFSHGNSPKTYRTIDLLSSAGLDVLNGRGTRVWRAVELEAGEEVGEHVALKDTWADPGRQTEGDIFESIRIAERQEEYQADIESRFPIVLCHGDVRSRGDRNALDCTSWFTMDGVRGVNRLTTSRRELRKEHKEHADVLDGLIPERRVHYRIVFKDVCKSLYQETSLSSIFHALAQIILTLRAMHSSGWVHRDVSPGNILLKPDGNALLVDVELAKPMGNRDERRVGTDDFIAVEVDGQRYLFESPPDPTQAVMECRKYSATLTDPLSLLATIGPTDRRGTAVLKLSNHRETEASPGIMHDGNPNHVESNAPSGARPIEHLKSPPFRYNPLHDLESVWWIMVYFLLTKEVFVAGDLDSSSSVIASDTQGYNAECLFYDLASRRDTVRHLGDFARRVQDVSPVMSGIGTILENTRIQLVNMYRRVEKDLHTLNYDCIRLLYEPFSQCFEILGEDELVQTYRLRDFTPNKAPTDDMFRDDRTETASSTSSRPSSKRSRSDFEGHSVSPNASPSAKDEATSDRKSKKIRIQHAQESEQLGNRHRPYLPRRAKTQAASRR